MKLCHVCAIGQSFENWLEAMEIAGSVDTMLALVDALFDGRETMFTGGWVRVQPALASGMAFTGRDEFKRPVEVLTTPAGREVKIARLSHPITGPWVGVNFKIR